MTRVENVCASALVCGLVLASAGTAGAQVIQPPPRSINGLFGGTRTSDPNRVTQELTVRTSLLGGYEDNVSPGDQAVDPLAAQRASATGLVSADLRYWRGTARRSFEVNAGSFLNAYGNLGIRPLIGGTASLEGQSLIRDSTTVTGSAEFRYEPTFAFTPGVAGAGGGAPPVDLTSGVAELSSRQGGLVASVAHAWTTRQSTSAAVSYDQRQYTTGPVADTLSRAATVTHSWGFLRTVSLFSSYQFSAQTADDAEGLTQPTDTHNARLGLEFRKRLSPTRTIVVSGGGGTMHVRTLSSVAAEPIEYVAPAAYASWRMDLGRTWAVTADMDRTTSVLDGITRQSFLTTNATMWLGGSLGSKLTVSVAGVYTKGEPHEGDSGSFASGNGTVQVQYALSRLVGLVTHYGYYWHDLRDVVAVPAGFPNRTERNQIRIGMTVWLPLYGTFTTGRQPGGRGN